MKTTNPQYSETFGKAYKFRRCIMGELMLVRPTDLYEEQVMSIREEMLKTEITLAVVQDLRMYKVIQNGLTLRED